MAHRVLVAHQPAFLPWPGYFTRLHDVERLVLLDHVQFTERGWQNRNTVADRRGNRVRLTVPVKHDYGQTLAATRIADTGWQARHWRTLTQCYGKATFWPAWADQLEEIFHKPWTHLTDLNHALIELLLQGMSTEVDIVRTSALTPSRAKTEMLIELCALTGAGVLRVGTGALGYLDHPALQRAGIDVEVSTYSPVGPLADRGGVSLLDTLLWHGPATGALTHAGAHARSWNPEGVRA